MDISFLDPVIPVILKYGYIAVVITALLEGASIPFPGSPILIIVGFIIYSGQVNIWAAILLGGLVYTLASSIPYFLGKNLKGNLYNLLERYCRVPRKRIASMEKIFYEYGDASICITRPFFIGNYISYLAGMAKINIVRYFILTFLGILPWMGLYLWLGYFFRGNYYRAMSFLDKYHIIGGGMVICGIVVIVLWKWKGREMVMNKINN